LAVLCVGGTELAASSYFAPVVYEQVTGTMSAGAHAALAAGQWTVSTVSGAAASAVHAVSGWADETRAQITALRKSITETPRNQVAMEPEVVSTEPVTDPTVTELIETETQELLTGGVCTIIYFNQGDEVWASQKYGTDYIGHYGCGPTAMAMVVSSFTDVQVNPAEMAKYASSHGYWAKGSGSYLSIVQGISKSYGLEAHAIDALTEEEMVEELSKGNLLVALMGPGHFTNSGHFILLRGVTLSGAILVADPNSRERSLTEWDAKTILDELSHSTSNGAPLWVVTGPAG
jgi:hypothetical protein